MSGVVDPVGALAVACHIKGVRFAVSAARKAADMQDNSIGGAWKKTALIEFANVLEDVAADAEREMRKELG